MESKRIRPDQAGKKSRRASKPVSVDVPLEVLPTISEKETVQENTVQDIPDSTATETPPGPADSPAEQSVLPVASSDVTLVASGAAEISVPLSAENIRAFARYAQMLKEWNERMNLTNITDDQGIALRHFVDSLTLVPHLEKERNRKKGQPLTLIDVGTGAGFPGIPLKVAMPDLEVTLLDSLRKRIGFLDAVCEALSLRGITTVHGRAEDAGRSKAHRERYDVATARAVASLPILCEYCMPFVKTGGVFLAMKGYADEEVEAARKAVVTLGGTIEDRFDFTLPGTDMRRSIIVIRKLRPTPPKFPRQAGKPEKEPLV